MAAYADLSLSDLPGAAETLLALFIAQLKAMDPPVEVPRRTYVSNGQAPAFDGAELTVGLLGLRFGMPGASPATSFDPHVAIFIAQWAVYLVREVPVVQSQPRGAAIPSTRALDRAGREVMQDTAALLRAAQAIHYGYLVNTPGMGFAIGDARPMEPAGGLAGCMMTFETSVD